MKATWVVRMLIFLLGFAVAGSLAYAQSEIDPDHFESPNTKPFDQSKVTPGEVRYDGRFTLPYAVACSGKRLSPGHYFFSLRSDGKIGQAILNLKGQTVGITGAIHKQTRKRGNDALIVEGKGESRTLSAIQLANFDLVLDSGPRKEDSSKNKQRRMVRLLLTKTSLQK